MKRIFHAIWNEFIYGGHLVALGMVSLVISPAILLGIHMTWDFASVIYLLALAPCLFGRYVGLKEDALTNPERSHYLYKKARRLPYVIGMLVFVMLGILVYRHKFYILLFGVALIVLSFLYDLFFKQLTKQIPGFKNFFIAMLFSMLLVMLAWYYHYHCSLAFWLVAVWVYVMTFIGTSFSDIKDLASDKKAGLKTFAVVLGHQPLLSLLSLVGVLATLPVILGVHLGLFPRYALMLLFAVPYNQFMFRWSQKPDVDTDFLYGVAFDSQLIWWSVFVLLGKLAVSPFLWK